MKRPEARRTAARITGEFLLIVVGVMVALAGDSWISEREEADRANNALSLLLQDLDRDAQRLAALASHPPRHDSIRAVIWSTPASDGMSRDSAKALIRGLVRGTDYRPIRSAYQSLLETDGLRHIEDPVLRSSVVEYYEGSQDELVVWYDWWTEFNVEFLSLARGILEPVAGSFEEALAEGSRLATRSNRSWSEIRSDEELMGQIWLVSLYSSLYHARALVASEANEELRQLISGYLGS